MKMQETPEVRPNPTITPPTFHVATEGYWPPPREIDNAVRDKKHSANGVSVPNEAVVEGYMKWQRRYFAAENARWKADDRANWRSTFFCLVLSVAAGLLVTACNLSLAFYHGTFPFAN